MQVQALDDEKERNKLSEGTGLTSAETISFVLVLLVLIVVKGTGYLGRYSFNSL